MKVNRSAQVKGHHPRGTLAGAKSWHPQITSSEIQFFSNQPPKSIGTTPEIYRVNGLK